jgi:hypothetical protein
MLMQEAGCRLVSSVCACGHLIYYVQFSATPAHRHALPLKRVDVELPAPATRPRTQWDQSARAVCEYSATRLKKSQRAPSSPHFTQLDGRTAGARTATRHLC